MNNNYDFLYNDEIVVLKLRSLYESCGFKKFRMGKFESYDFYAKNRDFLLGNRIITFSDLNGKLMALKPDVTLSIVKNADEIKSGGREKLYYTENVYRESKDIREFKEIFQVGLEVIGEIDTFETAEIISLAVKSLLLLDENAILDISHMGYIEGLLDCFTNDEDLRGEILDLISKKNSHDLLRLGEKHSLPKKAVSVAVEMMSAKMSNDDAINAVEEMALNAKMQDAVTELKSIYSILTKMHLEKYIRVDLSVTGDPGYYNGILMHGYVHGVSRDVLSGGRYDMLMSKMGKGNAHAMGFAIYFDALDRKLHVKEKNNAECYIIYDNNSDIDVITELTEKLREKGVAYSVLNCLPDNISGVRVYTVSGKEIKESEI
ncbi:MAG: ATP phosphoribosyltransferase regulatory subunit [Clostridiales bacterium]|nr:ATP phosphoribosyltransferase regulatory subunit [Clostridiales bacterium]